jgi:hypothetical protein
LAGVVDWCSVVEVNAANAPTLNGGRLIAGGIIRDAQATGGGANSLSDTATDFNSVTPGVSGALIRITAGTGSGQSNWVVGASSATQINVLNAWGVNPDATSVYQIVDTPTRDGVHPSANLHQSMADYLSENFRVI